jgi:hypothetical protein
MILQTNSLTADGHPDEEGLDAMRAALRDLKVSMRKTMEHPRRAEMLSMLSDARSAIERING